MSQPITSLTAEDLRGEKRIDMSYAQFLEFCDEDVHAEWEDGETIIFMPPGSRHQDVVTFLVTLLRTFTEFFRLGTVLTAPFEMKASPQSNAREPDILFVAQNNMARLTEALSLDCVAWVLA
jgi:Uma2 family endonuclease